MTINHTANSRLAILSDFDGTIVPFNVLNALFDRFGGPECKEITRRWDMGEISQKEEYRLGFATVSASQAEMETLLREVPIDPAFPGFVEFCRQRKIPLAITSDGLRWYIEYILHNHGVSGVPIYACEIAFHNPGYSVSYPHFDPAHPMRGVAKQSLVQLKQRQGYRVAFIGDGNNDIDPASVADIVFAKADLLRRTGSAGIPAISFAGFGEISDHLDHGNTFNLSNGGKQYGYSA
jgi:2,3-diketo-5-methylthio-1-phosphopentane phosphatase